MNISKRNFWIILGAFCFLALLPRMYHFSGEIGGSHQFRQSMIVNSVISFMDHPPSGPRLAPMQRYGFHWAPKMRLTDAPVLEYGAAKLADATGLSALESLRSIGLLITAGIVLFTALLALECGAGRLAGLAAALVMVVCPLQIQYTIGTLPDILALLLSLVSLVVYLRGMSPHKRRWYWLAVLAGLSAACIKAPVHLPAVVALGIFLLFSFGLREVFRVRHLFYFAVMLIASILTSMTTSYLNWGTWVARNTNWYFGTAAERLNPDWWLRIHGRTTHAFGSPVFYWLGVLGVLVLLIHLFRSKERKQAILFFGGIVGCLFTILVFFPLNWHHNYYELPYLPWYAVTVGAGIGLLITGFLKYCPRFLRDSGTAIKAASAVALIAFLYLSGLHYAFSRSFLNYDSNQPQIRIGKDIRAATPTDAYVIHFLQNPHHTGSSPKTPYLARRYGYAVNKEHVSDKTLAKALSRKPKTAGDTIGFYYQIPALRGSVPLAMANIKLEHYRLVSKKTDFSDPLVGKIVHIEKTQKPPEAVRLHKAVEKMRAESQTVATKPLTILWQPERYRLAYFSNNCNSLDLKKKIFLYIYVQNPQRIKRHRAGRAKNMSFDFNQYGGIKTGNTCYIELELPHLQIQKISTGQRTAGNKIDWRVAWQPGKNDNGNK